MIESQARQIIVNKYQEHEGKIGKSNSQKCSKPRGDQQKQQKNRN